MKIYIAELIGTFLLVFIGTGTVIAGGYGDSIDYAVIGLSFGIGLIAAAYAIGHISGAHLNPAVTLGVYLAKRMPGKNVFPYIISQIAGGILASFFLWILWSCCVVEGQQIVDFASNGWNNASQSVCSVFLAEVIATFVFVFVVLGTTSQKQMTMLSGVVIGLTLAGLHFAFIPISGSSLNPARSIGPALFSGSEAISKLWLYLLAPMIGGALAGLFARLGLFESGKNLSLSDR